MPPDNGNLDIGLHLSNLRDETVSKKGASKVVAGSSQLIPVSLVLIGKFACGNRLNRCLRSAAHNPATRSLQLRFIRSRLLKGAVGHADLFK
jgi:hypothetical protein